MSGDPKKNKPIGPQEEKLLDHNYDGIQELDNPLPAWWVYLFYITIVFGAVYFVYFTFFAKSSGEKADIAVARIKQADAPAATANGAADTSGAASGGFAEDAAALASGKLVFDTKCSVCHAPDGGGLIGPNMTDKYWIHGKGTAEDIYATIVTGVPDKGMISWKPLLSDKEIRNVTSYVKSLQGTTPAAPKAPQGDPV